MPWLRCQTPGLAQSMSSSFLITLYHGADVPRQENNNVVELRDKIKQFLASQGMIKGHSGSASSRSAEQEQTLQLADDPHHTPSGSPQSSSELILSDELSSHGALSSVREHHEIDGAIYSTSYPSTSYDSSSSKYSFLIFIACS
ncbi:hypothetical protein K435DRAFT_329072 [Dendrothele bispora CBS 962.96]|uniref:Uncharacterized protein n=1 Tax=Dendrothele bispora (strain CBS 962.96) TaxID=1314807 RepID=A0A4S8MVF5_DENBC|nr:hypothetical protein K435DRAFT_329072 [Dendrothele bispora CBS 962.96]